MAIPLSCSCGQQLQVADQHAGQRVKCPGCGQVLTAPARAASPPIKFSCGCGMVMQARAEHAGMTSQCPRCQARVVIPAGAAAAPAIQQKPSAPPPPPAATTKSVPPPMAKRPGPPALKPPRLATTEDDDLDFSAPSRGNGGRKRRSGSAMPWIIGAAVLLLLGGGAGAYFLFFAKKAPSGGAEADPVVASLQFVPGDAQWFVSVRVADVWKNGDVQKTLGLFKSMVPGGDLSAAAAAQSGLKPEDLARVTLVARDWQREVAWMIVVTNAPYDKAKLLTVPIFPNAREKKEGDKTYHVSLETPKPKAPGMPPEKATPDAVYFVNDRVLLYGSEAGVLEGMKYLDGKGGKGPLESALKVAEGDHPLVAGINPPAEAIRSLKDDLRPEFAFLRPLLDLKATTVTMDLGDLMNLSVRLHFPTEAAAESGRAALEIGITKVWNQLPAITDTLTRGLPGAKFADVNMQLKDILNKTKARQTGDTVLLEIKAPTAQVLPSATAWFIAKKNAAAGGGDGMEAAAATASLQYVPGDAQGFVSFRVADVWNSPVGRETQTVLLKSLPPGTDLGALIEKEIGIPVADLARVTFVSLDTEHQVMWVIVASSKPYDKDRILKSENFPRPTEAKAGGRTYHVSRKGFEENALYFVNDRVLLFGPPKAMPLALSYLDPGKGGKGALEGALKVAAGKHAVVAGINPPPGLLPGMATTMPPPFDAIKPVLDMKTATVVGDLGDGLALEVSLHFAGEDKAAAGKRGLDTGLAIARTALPFAKAGMAKSMPPAMVDKVYNQLSAILNDLKVEQKGSAVSIRTRVSQENLIAAVNMIQSKPAGPGFGPKPGPAGGTGLDAVLKTRLAAQRTQSRNNLLQLVLAMHNHNDTKGHLPAVATYGPLRPGLRAKRSLLSWRVQLLPYLEQGELYKQFHHDEPWNSPHNRTLIAKMPKVYALPGKDADAAAGKTYYKVFAGANTPFNREVAPRIPASFPDGTSNTILIVEAASPTVWTQPSDIAYLSPRLAKVQLGNHWGIDAYQVALADGVVRTVARTISDETLDHAIRPNDGMPLGKDW